MALVLRGADPSEAEDDVITIALKGTFKPTVVAQTIVTHESL